MSLQGTFLRNSSINSTSNYKSVVTTLQQSIQTHQAFQRTTFETSEELKELLASIGRKISTEQDTTAQLKILHEQKAKVEESLRLRDAEILERRREISGLEDARRTLRQDSENLRIEVTGLRARIAAQTESTKQDEERQTLKDEQGKISAAVQAIAASHEEARRLSSEGSAARQQELNATKTQLEAFKQDFHATKDELEDAKRQLQSVSDQNDTIKLELDSTKDLLEAQKSQLEKTKGKVDQTAEELNVSKSTVEELKSQKIAIESESTIRIKQMQGAIELKAEIERVLVSKLSRTTHELRKLQAKFGTRTMELMANITEPEAMVQGLKLHLGNEQAQTKKLQDLLSLAKTETEKLDGRNGELNVTCTALQEKNAELEGKLEAWQEGEALKNNRMLQKINDSVQALGRRVENHQDVEVALDKLEEIVASRDITGGSKGETGAIKNGDDLTSKVPASVDEMQGCEREGAWEAGEREHNVEVAQSGNAASQPVSQKGEDTMLLDYIRGRNSRKESQELSYSHGENVGLVLSRLRDNKADRHGSCVGEGKQCASSIRPEDPQSAGPAVEETQLEDTRALRGMSTTMEAASRGESTAGEIPCTQNSFNAGHSGDNSSPLGDTSYFFPPTPTGPSKKNPQTSRQAQESPPAHSVGFSFTVNTTISPSSRNASEGNRPLEGDYPRASSHFLSGISGNNFRSKGTVSRSTNPPNSETAGRSKRTHDGEKDDHENGSHSRRRIFKEGSRGFGPIIGESQASSGGPSQGTHIGKPRKSRRRKTGGTATSIVFTN